MSDILAVFRVTDMDVALSVTLAHDERAEISPVLEAGTDPERDRHLFSVRTDHFDRFESGLDVDHTIASYERVIELEGEAIYSFSYTDSAVLFSTRIGRSNGVVLNIENEGTSWLVKSWFPDREAAQQVWDFAVAEDIDIDLVRINEYTSIGSGDYGLTDAQQEAILAALDAGYFEEPRAASLGDVADELGISQPAAGGRLRRGIRRLVVGTIAESAP